jgi:hypothetical protein
MSIFLQCLLAMLLCMAVCIPIATFYEKVKKQMEAEESEVEE